MCKILGVSKSGYYEWRDCPVSDPAKRKQKLTAQIKHVFIAKKRYRSSKITQVLRREGAPVSQKNVSRIMKENGLRSKTVKKYKVTTNSKHSHSVYPNLLNQDFRADKPGKVWVSDITFGRKMDGFT